MGYLDDIPGYRTVLANGGTALPARNVLDFRGARLEDDPLNGQTIVHVERQHKVVTLGVAEGQTLANLDADLYLLTHAGVTINGLGSPEVVKSRKYRIWLCNAVNFVNLGLAHNLGSLPTSSIITPSGSTLLVGPQGISPLVWDPGAQRWRAY